MEPEDIRIVTDKQEGASLCVLVECCPVAHSGRCFARSVVERLIPAAAAMHMLHVKLNSSLSYAV